MASLGSEREGWLAASAALGEAQGALVGDSVLAACSIAYLGPFEASYRQELVDGQWRALLDATGSISSSRHFDLRAAVGDAERMQQWQLQGIPDDRVSTENMLILEETAGDRWPLLVDPQEQALAFTREYLGHDYIPLKATSAGLSRVLELALARGSAVICENVGELDGSPALTSLLDRDVATIAGTRYIRLDDNQVEFHSDFRMFLFTGLANPHFSPAVQARVKLLNFTVTQEGLEAQLLALVCKSECQKEEDEKHRLHR